MKTQFNKLIGTLTRQHLGLRQSSAALNTLDRVTYISRITYRASRTFTRAAIFLTAALFLTHASHAATNYVAHEWGTFTSVQGSKGDLLSWRPLQSSELPKFVYSAKVADSGLLIKTVMNATLQRLETPVIYFYAQDQMKVTADVSFPRGAITEWYPNVSEINTIRGITNGSNVIFQQEGHAVWRDVDIFPDLKEAGVRNNLQLPQDSAGSHYFAARATRASLVRATTTNNTTELEKFIFYRGAGSFKTPLRVTLDANNVVNVENTGDQPLAHLFLLNIHDGQGAFAVLDQLASGNSIGWQQLSDAPGEHWNRFDLAHFKTEIGSQVQAALTSAGLYPDEAQSMVNTWRDSWFTEDGVRVIYLLPRPWTDEILPLTLTPQPTELTRVMVGRAEVITTQVETNLFHLLSAAQTGDTNAQARAVTELNHLGRFSDPALQLAMSHTTNSDLISFSYQLLHPPQLTVTLK